MLRKLVNCAMFAVLVVVFESVQIFSALDYHQRTLQIQQDIFEERIAVLEGEHQSRLEAQQVETETQFNLQREQFDRQLKTQKKGFDQELDRAKLEQEYYGFYHTCFDIFMDTGRMSRGEAELRCAAAMRMLYESNWHLLKTLPLWRQHWRTVIADRSMDGEG